jgi:hypothetical protein
MLSPASQCLLDHRLAQDLVHGGALSRIWIEHGLEDLDQFGAIALGRHSGGEWKSMTGRDEGGEEGEGRDGGWRRGKMEVGGGAR